MRFPKEGYLELASFVGGLFLFLTFSFLFLLLLFLDFLQGDVASVAINTRMRWIDT